MNGRDKHEWEEIQKGYTPHDEPGVDGGYQPETSDGGTPPSGGGGGKEPPKEHE